MKYLYILLFIGISSYGQTLTVSGTTYEITGTDWLSITNCWTQGYNAGTNTNRIQFVRLASCPNSRTGGTWNGSSEYYLNLDNIEEIYRFLPTNSLAGCYSIRISSNHRLYFTAASVEANLLPLLND